jgi:hypothetical protein
MAKVKRDMTQGKILPHIVLFALPLIATSILHQLFNTADTVVVGRYAQNGDNAIAAIGSVFPVINLLLVLFTGISAGTGVMISYRTLPPSCHQREETLPCRVSISALNQSKRLSGFGAKCTLLKPGSNAVIPPATP